MTSPSRLYLSIAAYPVFLITLIALFYYKDYFPACGFIISILCTIHKPNRRNTLLMTTASIITLTGFTFFTDLEPGNYSPYIYFSSVIFLCGILVVYNKRSTRYVDKNFRELESLFNYATIGIVVTNRQGSITNFNPYAEEQFGYQKSDVLGKPIEILIPARFHGVHPQHREGFHHHPEPRTMGEGRDLRARKKDGTEFPTEISLSDYRIGNETYVIAFVVDITIRKRNAEVVIRQHKELEESSLKIKEMVRDLESKVENRTGMLKEALDELEKSKEELSEALEKEKELSDLKSRFVTIASHEFRTPLSTILSSAELLDKYNSPGEAQSKIERHIKRITSSVAGMKNILEDFLSLQKMEEGFIKANMQETSIKDCNREVQDTIHGMQLLRKEKQEIYFTNDLVSSVYIDLNLLRYILINLISNAIKFSGENSTIQVRLGVDAENLCLLVKDNGIGVSAEDQRYIFQRFFRATNAAAIQGTGLGLHIVSKYVELMKGSVRMESTEHIGTSFSICIPQKHFKNGVLTTF